MPQQPERTGIPPTVAVAESRAAVTEPKRSEPRVYKIPKARHLNLESAVREKNQPNKKTPTTHHDDDNCACAPRPRCRGGGPAARPGRRVRARSGVQVSKHSRQRRLPAPRRAPAAAAPGRARAARRACAPRATSGLRAGGRGEGRGTGRGRSAVTRGPARVQPSREHGAEKGRGVAARGERGAAEGARSHTRRRAAPRARTASSGEDVSEEQAAPLATLLPPPPLLLPDCRSSAGAQGSRRCRDRTALCGCPCLAHGGGSARTELQAHEAAVAGGR